MENINKNTLIGGVILLLVAAGLYMAMSGNGLKSGDSVDTAMEGDKAMMKDAETEKMMMESTVSGDVMEKDPDEATKMAMKDFSYQFSGNLVDVTDGVPVDGFNTGGIATGIAQASYTEADGYMLYATFTALPELTPDFFYEGWIVRKGEDFDVISTGPVDFVDGEYVNSYVSGADLTDHDFYVLTLEPDDGDPAPAGHIVEGTMTAQQ